MPERESFTDQIIQAFRDHGVAAAIGVWFTFIGGLAVAVTRKAFTNEALLHKLEQELDAERLRIEKRRDEDTCARSARREPDAAQHRGGGGECKAILYRRFPRTDVHTYRSIIHYGLILWKNTCSRAQK